MQIAIAGAGIMGRVLAWQLSQRGHRLSIFDRDPIANGSAAAYTAAGMLTPYSEVASAELAIHTMGMAALPLWSAMTDALSVAGGGRCHSHCVSSCGQSHEPDCDLCFRQQGSLIVAHPGDRADHRHFNQQVMNKLRPDAEQFQQLNAAQLAELEPELAGRFDEATYLPEESWVDNEQVMACLADALLAHPGVDWHPQTPVEQLGPHNLNAGGENYRFDWVIDCRGLGAKPDWPQLRGVRGELLWLRAPEVKLQHLVRLMHPRYRIYVVPRPNDIYIIGATQIESDSMGPITVRSSLELLSAAYSLHPGFGEAEIVSSRVNCRPALPDNLPAIRWQDGLIRANGLFRHGFLLAPAVAQEVVNWLENGDSYRSPYAELIQPLAVPA
ncbi:glycine oxidase ThiO [uncultured Porticoccus sp.]|uniref:glycine oxidase ThiO n=1 Tax=uncultured Porticoccus sp. TaxID=1256050 RepID=UPI002615E720|nr:glycine oxidase ThiO [uncultured Porticoccus sp.]